MKTLVTGGAGFIGSTLVDRLLAEGNEVVAVDSLVTGRLENIEAASTSDKFRFIEMDIRDEALIKLIEAEKPEVIFHLAAQADVRVSVVRPDFDAEVNVIGSLRVLEGARLAGVRKICFASSGGTIYGEVKPENLPVTEEHLQYPISPYGITKQVMFHYLSEYKILFGIDFAALALSNVYGPRQNPHGEAGVIAIWATKLADNEECVIYGDGTQTRDYVYVDDVVDAFYKAATSSASGLFNIGTGVETSTGDLYQAIANAAGVSTPAKLMPERAGELARSALATDKAQKALNWNASTDLAKGMQAVLASIRS